jgi:hypothetical protein
MSPLRALADGLIDYAGLFPPAALDMPAAVQQYAAYRGGAEAWALGRFIVPLARLDEMREAAAAFADAASWKPSVLLLPGEAPPPEIDSVELKIERAADIRRASAHLPALRYFEIPFASDPREIVAELAATGGRGKIRTGGLKPESYPGVRDVARFLLTCAQSGVPFKATAGLHHPIASPPIHGFVNLFLAAALAYHGGTPLELESTLEETSAAAFAWDADGVSWQAHRLTTAQIALARAQFAVAFGSCSFEEPMSGLQALGWL